MTNAVDLNLLSSGALEMGQEINSAALMELPGHIGRFQVNIEKSIQKLILKRWESGYVTSLMSLHLTIIITVNYDNSISTVDCSLKDEISVNIS